MDALAGYIAGNGRVFVLPAYLIDFIYINDAGLGTLDVATGILDQAQNDVFNVFTDIAGFCQRCRVDDCERDAQQARESLGQQGLSGTRWTDQKDVGFLQFDVGFLAGKFNALVVVVNGHGKLLFRFVLANNVLIEEAFDLGRFWKMYVLGRRFVILIFINNVLADANAFVADEDSRSRDQFSDVILALVAE